MSGAAGGCRGAPRAEAPRSRDVHGSIRPGARRTREWNDRAAEAGPGETSERTKMSRATSTTQPSATASGTFQLGGDLTVNRLGYGAMQLTGPGVWGPPADPDGAVRVLRRAIELGVNLIDTADSYGPYVSEELIAKALHPYPSDLVIATKAGLTRTGPNVWIPVGRDAYLRQEVEMSLRRLKVERIDLFQ